MLNFQYARDLFKSQEHKTKNQKKKKGMTYKRTMNTQPAYFWNGSCFPQQAGIFG